MKSGKKAAPAAPVVKRPRGRPRKPRNNTIDTAIVLSDSEAEDDEDDEQEQVSRHTKKRSLANLDSPSPTPNAKRTVSSYGAAAFSPPAAPPSARAEVDHLYQQLATEQQRRAHAEAQTAELQGMLQEKDSSWAADLAAHAMPLQLQLQRLTKENYDLDAACRDLDARLQATLTKNEELKAAHPNTEGIEAQMREKDALITSQDADINQLHEAEATRTKELAEANQNISELTATLGDLTARHSATTKMIQEHEGRIQHLTQALSEAKKLPAATDGTNGTTTQKAHETEERLAQAERQNADMKANLADLQCRLAASKGARAGFESKLITVVNRRKEIEDKLQLKEQELAQSEEMLAQSERMLADVKESLSTTNLKDAEMAANVADLQRQLAGLRDAQANMEANLEMAAKKRNEAEGKLKEKDQELARSEEMVAELNKNLASVVESEVKNVGNIQRQLTASNNARVNLEKNLAAVSNQRKEIEWQLKAKEQQLAEAEKNMAEFNGWLSNMKGQLSRAEQTIPIQAQQTIANLQRERCSLLEETQIRLEEMDKLENKVGHLQGTVAALEQQKKQLLASSAEKDALQKQLTAHKSLVLSHQKERRQFDEALNHSAEVTAALKKDLDQHKRAMTTLQKEKQNLSVSLNKASAQVSALETQIEQHNEVISTLQNDKQHLSASLDDVGTQADFLQRQRDSEKEAVATLQREKEDVLKKYQCALDRASQMRINISQLERDLNARNGELDQLRWSHLHGTQQSERVTAAYRSELEQAVATHNEQLQLLKAREQEARQLKTTVDALQAQITKLETKVATHHEELHHRNEQLAEKQRIITLKQSHIQQLQENMATVTTDRAKLADDLALQKDQLQQLATQLTQLATENAQLKETTATNSQTIHSLRNQLLTTTHNKDTLAQHIRTLEAQLTTSASTIANLTASPTAKHALTTTIKTLRAENTSLTVSLAALSVQTATATDQISKLDQRLAALIEANAALQAERDAQAAVLERVRAELTDAVAEREAFEEEVRRKEGCLERMRGFVGVMPRWIGVVAGGGGKAPAQAVGTALATATATAGEGGGDGKMEGGA
jgi:chromosome segregation ATPase